MEIDLDPHEQEEALRLKALAEAKFKNSNLKSALKYAKKANRVAPNLDGVSSMVTAFEILHVAAKSGSGAAASSATTDWYRILQVEPFSHINTIKKQYKKLALALHPDKNPNLGCEEAFKLVGEGFRVLSDKLRRKEYDMRLRIRLQEDRVGDSAETPETFWTGCSRCRLLHQFERKYLGHNLVCPSCKISFEAVEVEAGDKESGKEVRFRSEGLRNLGVNRQMGDLGLKRSVSINEGTRSRNLKTKRGNSEGIGDGNFKGKKGNNESAERAGLSRKTDGGKEKNENSTKKKSGDEEKSNVSDTDGAGGEWGGRLRSGALKRRTSSVGEVLERSKLRRVHFADETMTLAQMQYEARRKALQEKAKMKGKKDEAKKEKQKREASQKSRDIETEAKRSSEKSLDGVEISGQGTLKKRGNLEAERQRSPKKKVDLETETQKTKKNENFKTESRGASKKSPHLEIESQGDLEVMAVEDSDFYDFDKDRVERSFKKGQIWAIYDDDDGMPRHYGLINEVVSVNPFEVQMSWLDLQNNGEEGLINLEKMELHVSCGRFKVGKKTSIDFLNIFSHVMDCERAAKELYRIYPKKGSVWALYNEAALSKDGANLSARDKRRYDIVVFLTTYSEMHGLSMAYLEKVDGYKTIFKRREIGCHAIRWLEKDNLQLFSHQIPARKLSGDEIPENLREFWELDPASLPSDLLTIGPGR